MKKFGVPQHIYICVCIYIYSYANLLAFEEIARTVRLKSYRWRHQENNTVVYSVFENIKINKKRICIYINLVIAE